MKNFAKLMMGAGAVALAVCSVSFADDMDIPHHGHAGQKGDGWVVGGKGEAGQKGGIDKVRVGRPFADRDGRAGQKGSDKGSQKGHVIGHAGQKGIVK